MKLCIGVLRILGYSLTPKIFLGDIFLSSYIENTEKKKNQR
jgi:hypothetical protein